MTKTTTLKTLTLLILMIAGCNNDDRVARIATEAADRQAKQNEEMARLNREVAEGTKRLVEADAEARREMVVVHQELQGERGNMNQQWIALETERQEVAQQRRIRATATVALSAGLQHDHWRTALRQLRRHVGRAEAARSFSPGVRDGEDKN